MIDITKQYKTRDGREVRIYAVDGCGSVPVHGAILNTYGWEPYQWINDGRSYLQDGPEDLIEVKHRIKREVWLNVHKDRCTVRKSKEVADLLAVTGPHPRLACVKIVIDVEEGEGL
jgi:hypothetical protein